MVGHRLRLRDGDGDDRSREHTRGKSVSLSNTQLVVVGGCERKKGKTNFANVQTSPFFHSVAAAPRNLAAQLYCSTTLAQARCGGTE